MKITKQGKKDRTLYGIYYRVSSSLYGNEPLNVYYFWEGFYPFDEAFKRLRILQDFYDDGCFVIKKKRSHPRISGRRL